MLLSSLTHSLAVSFVMQHLQIPECIHERFIEIVFLYVQRCYEYIYICWLKLH